MKREETKSSSNTSLTKTMALKKHKAIRFTARAVGPSEGAYYSQQRDVSAIDARIMGARWWLTGSRPRGGDNLRK